MRNTKSIDALFPRTRQGILAATLMHSSKTWYASELARKMGVPSSSLQRELEQLTEAGILRTHRQGRMAYYQANVESPYFAELRGLMMKSSGLIDVLADSLLPLIAKIHIAFVYGSIASGDERSESDVDLMIIGSVSPMELALPLRRATEILGRPINPTVYTAAEFERKRVGKDHFLTAVLDKPKLFVVGNTDELGIASTR